MKNYQTRQVEKSQPKNEFTSARVKDYMVGVDDLITFRPDSEILDVVETLLEKRITGAPVLDENGTLVGMIDDKDCLKVIFDSAYHNQPKESNQVASYMSDILKTIPANADIFDIANTFLTSIYKRLLIVDGNGKLVGQISRRDILRAIRDVNSNAV